MTMTDEELSISDATLIERLRKADEYEPLGHDGWEAADRIEQLLQRIEALVRDRDAGAKDYCALMDRHDELHNALAAEQAKVGRLVDAMKALEKAAAEVSRRGAETGPQWTKLTVALLQARATLTQKDRTND